MKEQINARVPFWLVWSPDGSFPMYRHMTFDSAKTEAMRLSIKCAGQQFFVLEQRGCFQAKVSEWTEPERPF